VAAQKPGWRRKVVDAGMTGVPVIASGGGDYGLGVANARRSKSFLRAFFKKALLSFSLP